MTDPVERFTVDSLLAPEVGVRVQRPELASVGVHWHDYYELGLVLSGTAEHVVNGQRGLLRPGSAFLLSPADFHEIRVAEGESLGCYNTVLDPTLMEPQLAALGSQVVAGLPWRTDDFGDAEPDFERLREELERHRPGSRQAAEALVALLVVELARRCGTDVPHRRRAGAGEEGLRQAVLFVDRHFREPITLADAAERAHLSPNYFSERFRAYAGVPFQLYLQERRLRFARSLLAATQLSVSEVCHASGFNSLSHFGRAFRRRYGAPPSAPRRSPEPGHEHVTI
ncbi:AraC family transcriptional regulator [Nocardioides sp. YIM 152315]|uniref:AraC family transcriptional regulator n=1 Tax=Nocardioides sp. YIM 152315 TaxID=3031760 RepID=UPI0023DBC865|nr:AraC family transcriptional regulator [Nocardioides sp. YIM 152315]MDF1605414.1 AraC family transcriptional regulator [Nocardioides sp. YIM 152315]